MKTIMHIVGSAFLMSLLLTFAACGNKSTESGVKQSGTAAAVSSAAQIRNGSYEGIGSGRNDFIKVSTTFENGVITGCEVLENKETSWIAAPAINFMPAKIVENNSVNVDTITGCTLACKGIINGVKDCILQAGGDENSFTKDCTKAGTAVSTGDASYDADLVIVGAGGSGLTAAVRAAELGLKVVLIEKKSAVGGGLFGTEAHYSNDSIVEETFNRTDNQSAEEGYVYHMSYNRNRCNGRIVRAFMNNVGKTINWMIQQGNKPIMALDSFRGPGSSTWLMFEGEGPGVALTMQRQCNKLGVTTLLNTTGKSITMKEGKAVGIIAENLAGDTITVHAGTVIIATGGYCDNKEMLERYVSHAMAEASTSGGNRAAGGTGGRMGEGIQMCWAVGAAKQGTGYIAHSLNTVPGCAIDSLVHRASYQPYLWVNATGVRFSDETGGFTKVCSQPDGYYWSLLDQSMVSFMEHHNTIHSTCFTPSTNKPAVGLQDALDLAASKGLICKADSWEALAQQMAVPTDALLATIKEYNGYCEAGVDTMFSKDPSRLIAFGEGPYYACKTVGGMLTTIGGVEVNEKMEVVGTKHAVIPGLYCIGADAGGFYGDDYNFKDTGCASTFSFFSGKTAAESAASYLQKL
ncbi:FAD-dependent oxidoreductase [Sediminispirochaeta smaragdinae]|uniref:Fumarate reductase/succinate dehydrogenase flavoprotein domain protein n=1 Tax=Sediminispirochaeta smaragdinae (strain DSM 11293 / JCM 15392 / SEBR 4228) TaxID=573413 RepID=E1RCA6_SEDSS|nr:FAD-dependent oxidoreductase [Sediminispirochaeta smaragdinae]ADK79986.1 fumarate reductase/succinate dehydrogenase flavoprotein domain protein [Sediminispirochaeta smaragdinae DSM 11293]